MAGFTGIADYVSAIDDLGQSTYSSFHRNLISISTAANVWTDLATADGQPVATTYTGTALTSTLCPSGIYHGENVSPAVKVLHSLSITPGSTAGTIAPAPYYLCDYQIYYPGIDLTNVGGAQTLTTSTSLPRYTSGEGVRVMLIASAAATGANTAQITYTNSAGTSGRVVSITSTSVARTTGQILSGQDLPTAGSHGPFFPLASGDLGVRSVEEIVFGFGGAGATAGCLVLVKPLMMFGLTEVTSPAEFQYGNSTAVMPGIVDGACLNLIVRPTGNATNAQLVGGLQTAWK